MAKRMIVKLGDALLRVKSKEVTVFDERLAQLLDDMRETMISDNGVGIAAVQVGVLKRACIVSQDGEEFFEFINPVVKKSSGVQTSCEGCLSVPGTNGEVDRPKKITVIAYDRKGNKFEFVATGYLAIICCHEFDHMDGILFIDKMKKDIEKPNKDKAE